MTLYEEFKNKLFLIVGLKNLGFQNREIRNLLNLNHIKGTTFTIYLIRLKSDIDLILEMNNDLFKSIESEFSKTRNSQSALDSLKANLSLTATYKPAVSESKTDCNDDYENDLKLQSENTINNVPDDSKNDSENIANLPSNEENQDDSNDIFKINNLNLSQDKLDSLMSGKSNSLDNIRRQKLKS